MRLFPGDHFPRLAVQHGDLPRPWVMPSWAPRAHRDRLAFLLAQAVRALEPDLRLIELRWAERHALASGRILVPSAALVWWRVDAWAAGEPAAVVLEGSRLTPGLPLYDFDAATTLPAEAWLGPLKMAVLRRVQDELFDERPVAAYEDIADGVGELGTMLVSPIDLVTAAEGMVDAAAQGEKSSSMRAEAVARVIAGRFASMAPDAPVKALVAVGRKQELDEEGRALLRNAGLADDAGPTPLSELLLDEEVLRRAVLRVVGRRRLESPLSEIAPGLMPGRLATRFGRTRAEVVSPTMPGPVGAARMPPSEPRAAAVQEAWRLAQQDDVDGAASALQHALQQREDAGWAKEDLQAAGNVLLRAAQKKDKERAGRVDPVLLRPISALYEAAGDLLERGGSVGDAIRAWQGAGLLRSELEQRADAETFFERMRKLAEEIGDKAYQALGLYNLATVRQRTRFREALADAEQAAKLFRAISFHVGEAAAMSFVGSAYADLGEIDRAREAYDVALRAAERSNDTSEKLNILYSMGLVWEQGGDLRAALKVFEEGLALARAHKLRSFEAQMQAALGQLSLLRDEPLRANEAFEEALAIYRSLGDRPGEAEALEGLGDAQERMRNMPAAAEAYDAALALVRELGDPRSEARLLDERADLRVESDDNEGAMRDYQDALHLYETLTAAAARRWNLTERERAVLELAGRGKTNKEIAAELDVTVKAVEMHLARLFRKSGARNRVELTHLAWSNR